MLSPLSEFSPKQKLQESNQDYIILVFAIAAVTAFIMSNVQPQPQQPQRASLPALINTIWCAKCEDNLETYGTLEHIKNKGYSYTTHTNDSYDSEDEEDDEEADEEDDQGQGVDNMSDMSSTLQNLNISDMDADETWYHVHFGAFDMILKYDCVVIIDKSEQHNNEHVVRELLTDMLPASYELRKINQVYCAKLGFNPVGIFIAMGEHPPCLVDVQTGVGRNQDIELRFTMYPEDPTKKSIARIFKHGSVIFSGFMTPEHLDMAWCIVKKHTIPLVE